MRYAYGWVFCILILGACVPTSQQQQLQNVLLIIGDDHSYTAMGAYGNPHIETPHLDHLAAQGTRFVNAYSNAPICSASRQSILTGKYPHATGVNLLFTPFNDTNNYTIAEHLAKHGYQTAIFGKTHFNDWIWNAYAKEKPNYGFDIIMGKRAYIASLKQSASQAISPEIPTRADIPEDPQAITWLKNAAALPQALREEESEAYFFASQVINFMQKNKAQPFFACLAFHEPHAPFAFPIEYAGKYDPAKLPLAEGSEEDDRWIPEIFKDLSEEERRGIISAYYSSVSHMDANIGRVLEALEQEGLAENTVVIYLGDQGYLLNEHKRFEKHTFWAESVKAPLLIRMGTQALSGVSEAVVEFIDLAPTIFEALGLPQHAALQGESLVPLLRGDHSLRKARYAFSEYLEDNKAMIADQQWKYIFTTGKRDLGLGYQTGYGPSGIHHRLYDLKNDPKETHNLAYKAEYQTTLKHLQLAMVQRFAETHPDADQMPSNLTPIGQLIWFCEPRDIGYEPGGTLERIFEASD